ncbi:hypothetical protein L0337_45585, partial [candidate division KSB1 bacterium]|nr:hypothetical protein [candidate division KSB1 bacterium]
MFLSSLDDLAEPRIRTESDSQIVKQFKVSYRKIEFLALIVDLLLLISASIFGKIISQYVWIENLASAEACLAAGIVNGLLYINMVHLSRLYKLPVLLMPLAYLGRLLTIFAATAILVTGC